MDINNTTARQKITLKKAVGKFKLSSTYFLIKKCQYRISGLMKLGIFKKVKVLKLENLAPFITIDKFACFTNFLQKKQINHPLKIYRFNNCIVNSQSSAVLFENNLYYNTINPNEGFGVGNIVLHNSDNAILDLTTIETIEKGFFLGGNGSFNWFHWLIEILPKMLFYEKNFSNVILVDESINKFPTMMDSLSKFIDLENVKIIPLSKNISYQVKDLFFVDDVSKTEYNPLDSDLVLQPQFFFRPEILHSFSEKIIEKTVQIKNSFFGKRIYLKRKNTHRIANNEDEICNYLATHGFEEVDLMNLTFDEQISVFHNADIIVGVSGAAWSNLIFSKPGTKAVLFSPDNFKNFSVFKELADIYQVELEYLYYSNNGQHHYNSDFEINIEQLDHILNKTAL